MAASFSALARAAVHQLLRRHHLGDQALGERVLRASCSGLRGGFPAPGSARPPAAGSRSCRRRERRRCGRRRRRRRRPRRRSGCRRRAPARSRRRPPAPLTAAITGIGDPAQVDDRRVQRLGAAPHLGGQVDLLRLRRPAGTSVDVAAGAEGLAGAGDDQRPQRRRSASQAKATVISPIISGLIALNASGRSRVRVPISPSISDAL